jgi:hypothetical protein
MSLTSTTTIDIFLAPTGTIRTPGVMPFIHKQLPDYRAQIDISVETGVYAKIRYTPVIGTDFAQNMQTPFYYKFLGITPKPFKYQFEGIRNIKLVIPVYINNGEEVRLKFKEFLLTLMDSIKIAVNCNQIRFEEILIVLVVNGRAEKFPYFILTEYGLALNLNTLYNPNSVLFEAKRLFTEDRYNTGGELTVDHGQKVGLHVFESSDLMNTNVITMIYEQPIANLIDNVMMNITETVDRNVCVMPMGVNILVARDFVMRMLVEIKNPHISIIRPKINYYCTSSEYINILANSAFKYNIYVEDELHLAMGSLIGCLPDLSTSDTPHIPVIYRLNRRPTGVMKYLKSAVIKIPHPPMTDSLDFLKTVNQGILNNLISFFGFISTAGTSFGVKVFLGLIGLMIYLYRCMGILGYKAIILYNVAQFAEEVLDEPHTIKIYLIGSTVLDVLLLFLATGDTGERSSGILKKVLAFHELLNGMLFSASCAWNSVSVLFAGYITVIRFVSVCEMKYWWCIWSRCLLYPSMSCMNLGEIVNAKDSDEVENRLLCTLLAHAVALGVLWNLPGSQEIGALIGIGLWVSVVVAVLELLVWVVFSATQKISSHRANQILIKSGEDGLTTEERGTSSYAGMPDLESINNSLLSRGSTVGTDAASERSAFIPKPLN